VGGGCWSADLLGGARFQRCNASTMASSGRLERSSKGGRSMWKPSWARLRMAGSMVVSVITRSTSWVIPVAGAPSAGNCLTSADAAASALGADADRRLPQIRGRRRGWIVRGADRLNDGVVPRRPGAHCRTAAYRRAGVGYTVVSYQPTPRADSVMGQRVLLDSLRPWGFAGRAEAQPSGTGASA
jgi:hypothetical protein